MQRRPFVVVIDACGVGELPDAPHHGDGDGGANRLVRVAPAAGSLELPTFGRLALGTTLGPPAAQLPGRSSIAHA